MEKIVYRCATCIGLIWLACAYLILATYWDDYKDEYLIYNYSWNFPALDFLVWKVAPVLLVALCVLVATRVGRRY